MLRAQARKSLSYHSEIAVFRRGPLHLRYHLDLSDSMSSEGSDSSPNDTESLINSAEGRQEGSSCKKYKLCARLIIDVIDKTSI